MIIAIFDGRNNKYNLGIMGSRWVGTLWFKSVLSDSLFYEVIVNTLKITLQKLVFGFPAPIILALLLNDVTANKFKRTVQTLSYLPHFVSWVVVITLLQRLFSPYGGLINDLRALINPGVKPVWFMGTPSAFYPMVVLSDIWKGIGWGSIIYLAAMTNIDPTLYEASAIDGAGRWNNLLHITLPSLMPTIGILLIMTLPGIFNANFDQIYLMQTPPTLKMSEVLDTYILKKGLLQGNFGYSTAIGLFKSVVAMILIVSVNALTRKLSEGEVGLW